MPCSDDVEAQLSTSGSVRIPTVTLNSSRTRNDAVNVNAPTASEAERLDPELVEAAAVEEAAPSGRELLGELRHGEEAERQRAPDARHAVRRDRADGVVDPDPLDEERAERRR